ncbi:polysaccharide biosynthesis tyrosine autokinase [uncultured Winogradskyella sp.]|uniref:GumC family protein n=1 Tax=uncultured Winogradskyella sp. TaxID=395353 RepID=UPI002614699A|nr:polysaccharide biosynthesis tyrosine autokinase [uncultured Winogradskyella sp.]|tara:strand:- start:5370 stop:7748 length:2379 start_codon:yes stop_codon:yes gene_type:complete
MEVNPTSNSIDLRKKIDLFVSNWKIIFLCLVCALFLAFTYLRYTSNLYKASATIKIKDENQSKKLPSSLLEAGNGDLFGASDKIKDELQTIRSRSLIENVVKNLKLNITCVEVGNIKELERYKNPPVTLSFFKSDSIIHQINHDIFINVISDTEFIMFKDEKKSLIDRDKKEGKRYSFGDKIETDFGGFVITPNVGRYAPKKDSNLRISIARVGSVVGRYMRDLELSHSEGSNVIVLSLKEGNSHKAIDILNEIIKEYNLDVLADKEEVVKVTSDFINNRLKQVSIELEEVDYTAEQLQKKNRLTSLTSQADINLQSETQTESQIANTANKIQLISYLQNEITDPNRNSDLIPSDIGIGDASTSEVTSSYNDLVVQRDKILRNSSEKNPVVINLNAQISALKQNLTNSLNNMKKTSELTLNNLNKERARISGQIYAAPTKARQFRDIKRQQDIKESLYLYLLERREESAIKLGMYSPNAKIIDSAFSSHKPISPNPLFTYLAAIMFGLAMPMGLIYLGDLLNTKIYRKEDLTNLIDIPYLGDIPKSSKKHKLVKKVDYSPKAEAFRIVRSNIDFMLKDITGRAKKLFVTSTKAQEGKSHTSTNLATSISYSEKSVLLIETDIRVPKILDYLNLTDKPKYGLSDFIADKSLKPEDIVIKHKDNDFLDIIPSGTIPPNPSELLMSERVDFLFNYFEDKYDYIIADTSAVGIVSDTLLISKYADIFVYVVSVDNVDRRLLKHIAQPLYSKNRLPNMTMLLNGVKLGKGGGYGYGYGYGYGDNSQKKKKWYKFGKS